MLKKCQRKSKIWNLEFFQPIVLVVLLFVPLSFRVLGNDDPWMKHAREMPRPPEIYPGTRVSESERFTDEEMHMLRDILRPERKAGPQGFDNGDIDSDELQEVERKIDFPRPQFLGMPVAMPATISKKCSDGRTIEFAPRRPGHVFWKNDGAVQMSKGKMNIDDDIISAMIRTAPRTGADRGLVDANFAHKALQPCSVEKSKVFAQVTKIACEKGSQKVFVNSAYRSLDKNYSAGGAPKSPHLICEALDFTLSGGELGAIDKLKAFLVGNPQPNWGVGLGDVFAHLDLTRAAFVRWFYPKSGN